PSCSPTSSQAAKILATVPECARPRAQRLLNGRAARMVLKPTHRSALLRPRTGALRYGCGSPRCVLRFLRFNRRSILSRALTACATTLTQWRAFDGFALGVEDLKMVDAVRLVVGVSPDEFFVARDFQQLGALGADAVTGDHGVAVGQ